MSKDETLIRIPGKVLAIETERDANGEIVRARIVTYAEQDTAQLEADEARRAAAALCPPPQQGPGSTGHA
jgi:hypothetical protein